MPEPRFGRATVAGELSQRSVTCSIRSTDAPSGWASAQARSASRRSKVLASSVNPTRPHMTAAGGRGGGGGGGGVAPPPHPPPPPARAARGGGGPGPRRAGGVRAGAGPPPPPPRRGAAPPPLLTKPLGRNSIVLAPPRLERRRL